MQWASFMANLTLRQHRYQKHSGFVTNRYFVILFFSFQREKNLQRTWNIMEEIPSYHFYRTLKSNSLQFAERENIKTYCSLLMRVFSKMNFNGKKHLQKWKKNIEYWIAVLCELKIENWTQLDFYMLCNSVTEFSHLKQSWTTLSLKTQHAISITSLYNLFSSLMSSNPL